VTFLFSASLLFPFSRERVRVRESVVGWSVVGK